MPQLIFFPAYPYCVFPKLCSEDFLYQQDRFKSPDISMTEDMLKSPAYALSCYTKDFMNLLTISTFQDHPAWTADSQLNMQVRRVHQLLQFCQKNPVLVCQHICSPILFVPLDIFQLPFHVQGKLLR